MGDRAVVEGPQSHDGLHPMGYQPSLDGLRAVSVAVVLLYHAGFSWMSGGFFGVEVFFIYAAIFYAIGTLAALALPEVTGKWVRKPIAR